MIVSVDWISKDGQSYGVQSISVPDDAEYQISINGEAMAKTEGYIAPEPDGKPTHESQPRTVFNQANQRVGTQINSSVDQTISVTGNSQVSGVSQRAEVNIGPGAKFENSAVSIGNVSQRVEQRVTGNGIAQASNNSVASVQIGGSAINTRIVTGSGNTFKD